MSNYHNEKLDKIYKKLPKLNCKGKCTDACSLIRVGKYERERITKMLGNDPFIPTDGFLEVIQKPQCEWACKLLKDGKCTIYSLRPLICRLFGLVKKMQCPFGCMPEKWLTDKEASEFLVKAKYYDEQKKT